MTEHALLTDRTPRRRPRARSAAALAIAALLASSISAAATAQPQSGRQESDAPAAAPRREGPRDAPVLEPQARIGAGKQDPRVADPLRPPTGVLVREGAFIRNGRGRMVAGEGGVWAFIFDADASGAAEPPMILQPCIRLMEMRRLAEGKQETITFSVSGQVFVYGSRNYLLPTNFTTVSAEGLRSRELDAAGATAPGSTTREGAVQSDDPRAADLLRELEKEEKPGADSRPRAAQAAGPGGAPEDLLREGLTIIRKRGRIERGSGGSWVFVSDNGPRKSDDPGADAALRLAPCLMLQELERVARERGERQPITISGQIFVYDDRNYLIPTVFQLEPDREGNLTPAQ